MAQSRLHELSEHGVSVWFDTLSRELLETGELERMTKRTPSSASPRTRRSSRRHSPRETGTTLSCARCRARRRPDGDLLRPGRGGHQGRLRRAPPRLGAHAGRRRLRLARGRSGARLRPRATFEQAIRLHGLVDRPNCYVKIPATKPGLAAIEDCIARGSSINVTLIFSLGRYAEVAEAYLRGLERLVAAAGTPARSSRSRASSSRASTPRPTSGSRPPGAPICRESSRSRTRSSPTSTTSRPSPVRAGSSSPARAPGRSAACGRRPRPRTPPIRDTIYVAELVGPDVVNTMPLETIEAFQDHGVVVPDTLIAGLDEARQLLADLAAAGVDYDDVTARSKPRASRSSPTRSTKLLAGHRGKRGALALAR